MNPTLPPRRHRLLELGGEPLEQPGNVAEQLRKLTCTGGRHVSVERVVAEAAGPIEATQADPLCGPQERGRGIGRRPGGAHGPGGGRYAVQAAAAGRRATGRGGGQRPRAPPVSGQAAPIGGSAVIAGRRWVAQARVACSGQRGFAIVEQHLMTDPGGEHIVDFLQPG